MQPGERTAKLTIQGPSADDATLPSEPTTLGAGWYALRVWRELRRAMLELRFNYATIGLITLHTEGDLTNVLALDEALEKRRDHWFVREVLLQQARTLKMIDVTARTFFAIVTSGSCFAGSLFEVALAADRAYMKDDPERARAQGRGDRSGGGVAAGARHRRARRHRLGRRDPHEDRGATRSLARRADRYGSQSSFRGPRDHGEPYLRAFVRVAELDLHAPQCRG